MRQISSSRAFYKTGVLITKIRTNIGQSVIYALLLQYWNNLCHPTLLYASTHTIFTIHFNLHIVLVTALKQLIHKLIMITSILLTKEICMKYPCFTFHQHLTQLIILSLFTISILILVC